MATPSASSTNTGETRPNHNTMATEGGASSVPTAANNTGGGTGWGDKGFFKGGGGQDGPDTVDTSFPRSFFLRKEDAMRC